MLAFTRVPNDMVTATKEFLCIEDMQTHLIRGGTQRVILGFHWVSQSPFLDFVLVHNSGIDLYKHSLSGSAKMQHVRNYPSPVSHYWVEPVSGLLVVAVANKPGTLLSYFLKQINGPKAFEGPKVALKLGNTNEFWTSRQGNVSNLAAFSQTYETDPHRVAVLKLYENAYVAHLSCQTGLLSLYHVGETEAKLVSTVTVAPGGYDIREWDNLLIVQSYTSKVSTVFDIKADDDHPLTPFCCVNHRDLASACRLTASVFFVRTQHDFSLKVSLSYNNHKLVSSAGESRLYAIDTESPLTAELTFVDSNVAVDMRRGICYRQGMVVEELVADRPGRLESVKFLLRRWGQKQMAVTYLRKAILEGVLLGDMSKFFAEVNSIYKLAAIERKGSTSSNSSSRKSMPSSPQDTNSSTPKRSLSSQPELKIETGETVLLQAEMSSLVFLPALEDFSVDPEYLTSVVIEYHRSLVNHDIQVHQYIQLLCAKLLIRTGNFTLLHSLIQFQVLSDSKELATMLLAIANSSGLRVYPAAMQLALDMLLRLNLFEEIVEELIDRKMVPLLLVNGPGSRQLRPLQPCVRRQPLQTEEAR